MKKGSRSRKCKLCRQIIFWSIPKQTILGLVTVCDMKTVRPFRFIKEKPDGSGNYYCMDCLKFMYPDKY